MKIQSKYYDVIDYLNEEDYEYMDDFVESQGIYLRQ